MIRSEGEADTGKTEFAMSAPGPGAVLALDRGFDAAFDNQEPPKSRRDDFAFKVIRVPASSENTEASYFKPYWQEIFVSYVKVLNEPAVRTVVIDGDNHGWNVQRLAEHGRLTGVYPATRFTDVYAARRSFIARAWDSGKIIIFTNWLRDEFVDVLDAQGNPILEDNGQKKRERSGKKVPTGAPDAPYSWQVCIRHLYKPPVPPVKLPDGRIVKPGIRQEWGLVITKAKAKREVEGMELWGDQCNFTGLVQTVYPHIPLEDWGF